MDGVFFQTGLFFIYMGIAYAFKKLKILKKEDAQIFSKIIMNLTLPCLFFSSANGMNIDASLIIYILLGVLANGFMMLVSYLIFYKENKLMQGVYMIACSGYDVGNFILPFVSVFFPGMGVLYLCSFNIANVMISMGITYATASHLVHQESHFDIQRFIKDLLSSVSFDVYILIIIIACLHITLPQLLIKITSSIGSVNSFLVMTMIGLKLELHMNKETFKQVLQILITRFSGAILLSIMTFFLPIPMLAKNIFIVIYFAPLVSVSSIYTRELGYQGDVVVNANLISILLSLIMTTLLFTIFFNL